MWLSLAMCLLLVSCGDCGRSNSSTNNEVTWEKMLTQIKSGTNSLMRSLRPYIFRNLSSMNISVECERSMIAFFLGVLKMKPWTIKMVDAMGKVPSGLLEGTTLDFGSYEECLKIRVYGSPKGDKEIFRGRYCMVGLGSRLLTSLTKKTPLGQTYIEAYGQPPELVDDMLKKIGSRFEKLNFWFGTCIPSACSSGDLQNAISSLVKPLIDEVIVADCHIDEPVALHSSAITAICALSFLALICVMGTLLDVVKRLNPGVDKPNQEENTVLKSIKAFSILTNTEKLFNTSASSGSLGCFHGIRFLSTTWVILEHSYFFTANWKYSEYGHIMGFISDFNYNLPLGAIENIVLPVVTFFFVSGFMMGYSTWKQLEKKDGRLNLPMFFVHKYWRFTPNFFLILTLFMIVPYIGSGPVWNSSIQQFLPSCYENWWTNLLYINNWWTTDKQCLPHTWYMSCLMQLHIIGVLILIQSYRHRVAGLLTGFAVAVVCSVITIIFVVWKNFGMPAVTMMEFNATKDWVDYLHTKPYSYAVVYLAGMIIAYTYLKNRHKKLNQKHQVFGWILSAFGIITTVYGIYGPAEDVRVTAFYFVGHRIAWALSLGWIVYTCSTGHGGVVNRMLSWNALVPLSNLSYLVYLLHPFVLIYRIGARRERMYYSHTNQVFEYLATVVISFFLAFLGHIIFEAPFNILEGIIFKKRDSINLKEKAQTVKDDNILSIYNKDIPNP